MLVVADSGIGNITAALKRSGVWQNALLVLSADNGGDCVNSGGNCEHSGNCGLARAGQLPSPGRACE